MKRLFFKAAFAAVLAAGLSVAANATDNPTGERQAMMKNVGAAIGMGMASGPPMSGYSGPMMIPPDG